MFLEQAAPQTVLYSMYLSLSNRPLKYLDYATAQKDQKNIHKKEKRFILYREGRRPEKDTYSPGADECRGGWF